MKSEVCLAKLAASFDFPASTRHSTKCLQKTGKYIHIYSEILQMQFLQDVSQTILTICVIFKNVY